MTTLAGSAWWKPASDAGVEARSACARQDESGAGGGIAFRALIVFMVILLLAPQNHLVALKPLRLALLAATVGVIARLADSVRHGRALTVGGRAMTITASLVGWAVATAPLSYWPGGSASFLLETYLKTVAIFWLLANAVDRLARLWRMAWTLTWLSVPLALTGIKHFLAGIFIQGGHAVKRVEGYDAGLTSNPNDLALMLNLILPLSLALLVTARTATARAVLLLAVALQTTCVIVTFSRAGFLTLVVVFTLFAWRLVRRGRAAWSGALLAIGLLGLLLVPSGYSGADGDHHGHRLGRHPLGPDAMERCPGGRRLRPRPSGGRRRHRHERARRQRDPWLHLDARAQRLPRVRGGARSPGPDPVPAACS